MCADKAMQGVNLLISKKQKGRLAADINGIHSWDVNSDISGDNVVSVIDLKGVANKILKYEDWRCYILGDRG